MEIVNCDVAIVGAGGAGLRAAIALVEADPKLRIALISKVYPMRSHTCAAEGGAACARNLLAGTAGATPFDPGPFFWSDQYATKIQMIGLPDADDEVVVVSGSGEEGKMIALYRSGDRLGGVLTLSQPAKLMGYRPLLAAGASFDEALALARS